MVRRTLLPTACFLALLVADLALVGAVADATEDSNVNPLEPLSFPAGAMLTGLQATTAKVDDLEVRVVRGDGTFTFVAENPTPVYRELALEVECWATSGSPMSRMGPMRSRLSQDLVVAKLDPGTRHEQALSCAAPSAPEPADDSEAQAGGLAGLMMPGAFVTHDFEVRRKSAVEAASEGERAEIAAQLRTWEPVAQVVAATAPNIGEG